MNLREINEIMGMFWKKGYGSITSEEAFQINNLISEVRPVNFLEIGTASGLSGGLICQFLEEYSGVSNFTTVDYDNTFFSDKEKENGFLINEIYKGYKVKVSEKKFNISVDIAEGNIIYDMAFIDANHMHPWPTLDTLALLPKLKKGSFLIHHDYNLFKIQSKAIGIGPKFLFDQWEPIGRIRYPGNEGNMFGFIINENVEYYSNILTDSLNLPWTQVGNPFIKNHGSMNNFYNRYRKIISDNYDVCLLEAFDRRFDIFQNIHC